MTQIMEYIRKENIKRIILICGVGLFAAHSFYFITILGVNYPYIDDWEIIKIGVSYYEHDVNWYEKIFEQASEHRPTIPRIVQTISLFWDSFNLKNLMYFSWALLIISVYAMYKILKRTDSRLTWLIIPISGFVFSPKQIDTMLYALGALHWVTIFFSGVITIYFLNRSIKNKKNFSLAIFASVIGTFTAILGLISWVIGFISLNPKNVKTRKFFIVWALIAISIITLYLISLDTSKGEITGLLKIESLFSKDKIIYMLEYISNPFSVKFTIIRILIGIFVISALILTSIYLIRKTKDSNALPWIQFAAFGFLATLGTVLARSSRSPFDTRYIVISNFLEIALLVLASITILNLIKHYPSKKKILHIMLIIFVITQMGLLGTGYYNGWNLAEERYEEMQSTLSCGKLPTEWKSCEALIDQGDYDWKEISILINFVIEHKLNLLTDNTFNQENFNAVEISNYNILKNNNLVYELGEINMINNKEEYSILVKPNEPLIEISGWIKGQDKDNVNNVFLIIDQKPFVRMNLSDSEKTDLPQNDYWSTMFFSGYLEKGCHTVQVARINAEKISMIDDKRELCVQ